MGLCSVTLEREGGCIYLSVTGYKPGKMNINDIAGLAGVSKATVSRVLAGNPKVKETTREQIQKIINESGYQPNYLARSLSSRKTFAVGVIVEEMTNPFFSKILSMIENILNDKNYTMSISSSNWVREKELAALKNMMRNSVDGLIVSPIAMESDTIDILRKSSIPVILLNSYTDDERFSCVSSDNFQGGRLAAEHICTVPPAESVQVIAVTGYKHQTLNERMDGFYAYMDQDGSKRRRIEVYEEINTYEDGLNLVPTLLTRNRIDTVKTCLFVTNDNVAMGVQEGLLRHDIAIPGDVRLIGYDNIEFSGRCRVPLTTIEQSSGEMGRIAAMEILDMIENHNMNVRKFRLPTRLILRDSSP